MADFTVDLMFAADKADISKVSEANMAEYRKRATYTISVVNALNKAIVANGLPAFRFNSGWRSYAHLQKLFLDKSKSVAKPGTSSHESGGAVDLGIQKNATGGAQMKFAVKWFIENKIAFDQIMDESSGGAYGWLHVGIIRTVKPEQRCLICVSWHKQFKAFKDYYSYVNYRNTATLETSGREAWKTTTDNTKFTGNKSYSGGTITVLVGDATSTSGESTSSSDESGSGSVNAYVDQGLSTKHSLLKTDPKESADAYEAEEALLEQLLEEQSQSIWELNAKNANSTATYSIDTDPEIISLCEDFLEDIDAPKVTGLGEDTGDDSTDDTDDTSTNDSSSKSVLENAGDNASDVSVDDKAAERRVPPKIYAIDDVPVTIQLDSIELNMSGAQSAIDQSTGLPVDVGESNRTAPVQAPAGTGGNYVNNSLSLGQNAPLIRINDKILTGKDIELFKLIATDKIPTIILKIKTPDKAIAKKEFVKEGDICSVYMNMGVGMVKSYRGDFKITNVITPPSNAQDITSTVRMTLFGELYIPAYYLDNLTFITLGDSMMAIVDAAKKLGLTVLTNEPENPHHLDVQIWPCTLALGHNYESNLSSTIGQFIDRCVMHAYNGFNSFYDWWIDPRYGLAFIDINKQLGATELDEEVDLAFFKSAYSNQNAVDGNTTEPSLEETTNKPKMKAKLFTNIASDATAQTSFYVTKYSTKMNYDSHNKNSALSQTESINIKNTGVDAANSKIDFKYSLCINSAKLANGFYVLDGPGLNLTYLQANNGDYTELHASTSGGNLVNIQSDDDAAEITNSKSNMLASGNTHKFYSIAKKHNQINNYQLLKKVVELTCNGLNLQITRGEKVPVLMVDNGGRSDLTTQTKDDVLNRLQEDLCGWFMISGLTWVYDQNKKSGSTLWETIVNLVRREWPIPGYKSTSENTEETTSEAEIVVTNDIDNGTTTESKTDETIVDTSTNETKSAADQVTTEGLSDDLKTFYTMLNDEVEASGIKMKLVSGRRWAADASGNRLEGSPTIQENGLYKFVNANGDIVWYSSNTSRHITGDAIDIINGEDTEMEDILDTVLLCDSLLCNMFETGIYCAVETSKDDLGNTVKHFHFGKVDLSDSTSMKSQLKWWEAVKAENNTSTLSYTSNGKTLTYNIDNYLTGNA